MRCASADSIVSFHVSGIQTRQEFFPLFILFSLLFPFQQNGRNVWEGKKDANGDGGDGNGDDDDDHDVDSNNNLFHFTLNA